MNLCLIVKDPALPSHCGMSKELTDKVALVTGGARGIGAAIAAALLAGQLQGPGMTKSI